MRKSSPATLIGACLLGLVVTAASAQPVPVPTPAPKPKSGIAPPPAAVPDGKAAQLTPAQSGGGIFPFKLPGLSPPGTTTAFDANQRAPNVSAAHRLEEFRILGRFHRDLRIEDQIVRQLRELSHQLEALVTQPIELLQS